MLNKPPKKKRPHNKLLVLTAASFQMGVTIYLGAYLGDYLESTYLGASGHVKTISVVLSVFISIYTMIKQTKKLPTTFSESRNLFPMTFFTTLQKHAATTFPLH